MDSKNEIVIVEVRVRRSTDSEELDEARSEAPIDSSIEIGKQVVKVDSTLQSASHSKC